MKKKTLLITIGILVILIGLALCLLIAFLGLYGKTHSIIDPSSTAASSDTPESYLINSWQFHDCQWDRDTNTITAIRTFDISYEDGKKVGGAVFTEDLAPESYLSQTLTIAADLDARFSTKGITVVISFRSNDGMELFSVDSNGNISTCWSVDS